MNFQDELRRSIRTPEEVNKETVEKESEARMTAAKQTLADIKNALMSNAQSAKYSTQNGATTVSCLCRISQRYLRRRTVNNSEQLKQNQQKFFLLRDPNLAYCTWDCFEVEPNLSDEYYQYIEMLKQLAAQENITVEAVIHDATDNKEYPFPIKLKRFYSVHCYLCVRASTTIS